MAQPGTPLQFVLRCRHHNLVQSVADVELHVYTHQVGTGRVLLFATEPFSTPHLNGVRARDYLQSFGFLPATVAAATTSHLFYLGLPNIVIGNHAIAVNGELAANSFREYQRLWGSGLR